MLHNLPLAFVKALIEGIVDYLIHLILELCGSLVLLDRLGCLFLGHPVHHLTHHGLLLDRHGPALGRFKPHLKSVNPPPLADQHGGGHGEAIFQEGDIPILFDDLCFAVTHLLFELDD